MFHNKTLYGIFYIGIGKTEYSGQKKPLVRNGGNCNTDFKETILIVLILCSIQNVGTARDS